MALLVVCIRAAAARDEVSTVRVVVCFVDVAFVVITVVSNCVTPCVYSLS